MIVIDRAVFTALSRKLGHSMSDVTSHGIFSVETDFPAAFKSAALRDQFNQRLTELCDSGGYADIYCDYNVDVPLPVCDHRAIEAPTAQY